MVWVSYGGWWGHWEVALRRSGWVSQGNLTWKGGFDGFALLVGQKSAPTVTINISLFPSISDITSTFHIHNLHFSKPLHLFPDPTYPNPRILAPSTTSASSPLPS